jgi:UDP-N-acetylmuramoylalanine--D-glutamate ligase
MYFGELPTEVEEEIDLVVLSPGVPTDCLMVQKFRDKGIKIWGEIELAFQYSKGDLLAITGTNGKTTTTALLGCIMKDYFDSVYVVGNIGIPYTHTSLETKDFSVTVAEISSFQLETIETFKPKVSAILNITPDHLNRHHTMECYVEVKEKITRNQGIHETVVLNYDDPYTYEFGNRAKCNVLYFSRKSHLKKGICLDGNMITYYGERETVPVLSINDMQILGGQNIENAMAAIGLAISYGVPIHCIASTVKNFKAVEHRIEFVKEICGVQYYNDSKGTNVDAAIKGIQAMNRKTILIGGGYDKESEYDEWITSFDGKVKYLILLGQTAEKIAECAKKHGFHDIIMVENMKEAVDVCKEKAEPGEAVLLSPACASWGMFKNYEERGNIFKSFVNRL